MRRQWGSCRLATVFRVRAPGLLLGTAAHAMLQTLAVARVAGSCAWKPPLYCTRNGTLAQARPASCTMT